MINSTLNALFRRICLSLLLLPGAAFAENHYVIECKIFNEKMQEIRSWPGSYCLFNDDGSFLQTSGEDDKLSLIAADGRVLWKREIPVHHAMTFSLDKKQILVLSQDFQDLEWCDLRNDLLVVLDLKTGRTLKKMRLSEDSPLGQRERFPYGIYKQPLFHKSLKSLDTTTCEISHLNAIYEIPANLSAAKIGAFSPGNYLVSDFSTGLYVVDHDLKKVLWRKNFFAEGKIRIGIHDSQMLPDGNILVYSNAGLSAYPSQTTILIYDPVKDELAPIFPRRQLSPFRMFRWLGLRFDLLDVPPVHSNYGGTTQLFPEGILLSFWSKNSEGMAMLVDAKGGTLWRKVALPRPFFALKRYDLTSFLRNNRL